MPAYNRSPLSADEVQRFETLNEKILAALQECPQTNAVLSKIALDYGRRIRDLRREGYRIDRERIDRGLNRYTLKDGKEPAWEVLVGVTLADGTASVQNITVYGEKEGLVRNRAQHLATHVKILGSRPLP